MTAADDIRLMFDSRYIGAWDLRGQDVTVQIESITPGVVEGEKGRKDKAPLVKYRGWDKPMVLNKTNMKSIFAMYATHSRSALVGKNVTLYETTCQGAKGGTVSCIRIRPTIPTAKAVPQKAVGGVPVDQAMRAKQVEQSGREPGSDDT